MSSVSGVRNAPVPVQTPPVKAAQTTAQSMLQSVLSTKPAPDGDSPATARAERLNGGIAPKSGVDKIA